MLHSGISVKREEIYLHQRDIVLFQRLDSIFRAQEIRNTDVRGARRTGSMHLMEEAVARDDVRLIHHGKVRGNYIKVEWILGGFL